MEISMEEKQNGFSIFADNCFIAFVCNSDIEKEKVKKNAEKIVELLQDHKFEIIED